MMVMSWSKLSAQQVPSILTMPGVLFELPLLVQRLQLEPGPFHRAFSEFLRQS